MGFFEKKINKRLAGFLLGWKVSDKTETDNVEKKPTVVWNVRSFLHSGLKEMEKELNGKESNPMEVITTKKEKEHEDTQI